MKKIGIKNLVIGILVICCGFLLYQVDTYRQALQYGNDTVWIVSDGVVLAHEADTIITESGEVIGGGLKREDGLVGYELETGMYKIIYHTEGQNCYRTQRIQVR